MKITSVTYWKEDMKLTRPYAVTYVMHDSVENIFVRIDASNGHYGVGAGSPSKHVTGEEIDSDFNSRRDEIEEQLVGTDLRCFRDAIHRLSVIYANQPALLAGLDMALHDLFCKSIGISLGKYLGVRKKPLPTSITIGIKNVEETVEEGIEYKERGFQVIKLKIGQSIEEDIERSLKLRAAIGDRMLIRVDANQGYDVTSFQYYLDKTKKAKLEFFEQPMKPEMNQEMLDLPLGIRELCAADESLHKQRDAIALCKLNRPFGILNIKLMKCGGLTESKRIADIANNESLDLMWGCMDESVVSISAALNSALSCESTQYLDLDGSLDLASDIASGGFEIREGVLYPNYNEPGLGVKLL